MADNLAWTVGAGTTLAADDISSVFYPRGKVAIGNDGAAADWGSANPGPVSGYLVECSTDITRPADTTTYAANDALAATTPASGGQTWTNAARVSGGAGIITDCVITTSADPALLLVGEIWVFDQTVTAVSDNIAFAVSDTEIKTCVGKIPFVLEDAGNNGFCHVQNLNIGFVAVGSANLRFLVRVKNAYIPVSGEVLTFNAKILQITEMLLGQRFGLLTDWSPLELLAGGVNKGFWYDPQDLSSLFQTSTATTAVSASGDLVGYMIDKSGQGNHAVRAVADANRAAWTATTDGHPYLLFSATKAYALPTSLTQAVGAYTLCFAVYPTTLSGNPTPFSSQDNSTGERLSFFFSATTANIFGDRADGGAGATFTGPVVTVNQPHVILVEENFYTAISEVRVNRLITRAAFLTAGVTNNTAASFIYIGAFPNNGTPSSAFVGRLYGMFGIGHRILSEGDKRRLMNFMGQKIGLVI